MDDNSPEAYKERIVKEIGPNCYFLFEKLLNQYKSGDLTELRDILDRKYKKLGTGSVRRVYALNDSLAIKIPCGGRGWYWAEVKANLYESIIWKRCKHLKLFFPTKLYFYKSVPVIITERATALENHKEYMEIRDSLPKEHRELGDGITQIGKSSRGPRCYDFGLEEDFLYKHKKGPQDFTLPEVAEIVNGNRQVASLLTAA
jgi:hypothetical protein